ncbi:MAG: GNAT family N-acetyltransferase [Chloroflexi bacterium GWB2_49_20]|nr:MAG: GNAT family N-acetyltransferase [Chloroflexi bacterium GWB2_49_20]OGN79969.1 MAG: GNAT family N-acetyltransferase [Chloroflexi bacterium GWC2_49_37]OGN85495.1 MAG: GNAT family N-acetyltransferase [Chloroflexi bacterium GWD2_49_16]HBG74365.1 GNAT family N-acetyltransferase [Anaerolineae bacterium]HCM97025.1 GNAT family N-acetyltransferase [Anaerolineae bacterium]
MRGLWQKQVTLFGEIVRLEPLSEDHVEELAISGKDVSIWKYMLYGEPITEENMRGWVRDILKRQDMGSDLPFAVIHLASGKVVGATRYLDMRPEHKGLEIGGTWYSVDFQRTGVNTESKYLLLKYAFEDLGCIRVQFKTDLRNIRSQRAIERLGALKEGILRNHMITPEGVIRDSVYYSILDNEWSKVKSDLEEKLS